MYSLNGNFVMRLKAFIETVKHVSANGRLAEWFIEC